MADNDLGFVQDDNDLGFQPEESSSSVAPDIRNAIDSSNKSIVMSNPLTAAGAGLYGAGSALKNIFQGKPADFQNELAKGVDTASAALQGGEQGLSYGGADELQGALAAPGVALSKGEGLGKAYREIQQGIQESNKKAQQQNPKTYMAGELTGALYSPINKLFGGVGSSVSETLGAQGFKKAAEQGVGAVGKELLKKAVASGAEAAVAGGAMGALGSEGTVDQDPGKIVTDTMKGLKTGAKFGTGIGLLGGALEGAAQWAKNGKPLDTNYLRQVQQRYKDSLAGKPSIGPSASGQEAMANYEVPEVNKFYDKFKGAEENIYKDVNTKLTEATEKGITVPITEPLDGTINEFLAQQRNNPGISASPEYQKLSREIEKIRSGELTPNEAISLKQKMGDFAAKFGEEAPAVKRIADSFKDGLEASIDSVVPGYAEANNKFQAFRSSGPETLGAQGLDLEHGPMINSYSNPEQKIKANIKGLLQNLTSSSGEATNKAAAALKNFKDNMTSLQQQYPDIIGSMGYSNVDEMVNDIRTQADRFAANRKLMGGSLTHRTPSITGFIAGHAEAIPFTAAQALGKVQNKLERGGEAIKNVFAMPKEFHPELAQKLMESNNPLAQSTGSSLQNALQSNDQGKINATLFVIQQNPSLRKMFSGDNEENEQ